MEWFDLASRIGGSAGVLVAMVYALRLVMARDGEWKELIERMEAEIARKDMEIGALKAEVDRLRKR